MTDKQKKALAYGAFGISVIIIVLFMARNKPAPNYVEKRPFSLPPIHLGDVSIPGLNLPLPAGYTRPELRNTNRFGFSNCDCKTCYDHFNPKPRSTDPYVGRLGILAPPSLPVAIAEARQEPRGASRLWVSFDR